MPQAGRRLAAIILSGALLATQTSGAWAAPETITRNPPHSVSTPEAPFPKRPSKADGLPAWWWVVGILGGAAIAAMAIGAGGGGGGGGDDPAPQTGSIDVTF